ncbi:Bug family tripartite tricarboxylate transporter substrate binding protein [Cupriavidus sp. 2TAF22]
MATAVAQTYPSKAVRVIIPFPPGGPTDTVGRMLAQKLAEQTGQSFIVDNRPGGQGIIGADAVAKGAADGYTLLFSASTFTTTPMTLKSSPYDVTRDFTPVALVGKGPLAVSVNRKLPINNIKELIAYAQAHPGKMSFAIGSQASAGHLSTEMLKRAGKIDYLVVPYKGSAPAYQDLIGGAIDGFIDPVLGALTYHKSGMVRVVAVTSKDRLPSMPDVPTVGETVPGYEFYSWYGLWGPAKLPAEVTRRLNAEVNKALSSDLRARLAEQGYLLSPGTPEDFARFEKEDMARSAKIVAEAKIRAE